MILPFLRTKKQIRFAQQVEKQIRFAQKMAVNAPERTEAVVEPIELLGFDPNSFKAPRVIVMTSGKGGVGKTTSTANIGTSIARAGFETVLIDADIGLRNLDLLLGLENRVLYTAQEVFDQQCRIEQALVRDKTYPNLALLPVSKNRDQYQISSNKMRALVSMLQNLGFQYIIIDCPAGIDTGFVNAIAAAKEAVVVTTPEITAIRDADRVVGLLEARGISTIRLLINRVRADMIQQNDMMSVEDVQDILGLPLLGVIPEDKNVIVSTNRGKPLVSENDLSLAGIAYENAARRLMGFGELLLDIVDPYISFKDRIRNLFGGPKNHYVPPTHISPPGNNPNIDKKP